MLLDGTAVEGIRAFRDAYIDTPMTDEVPETAVPVRLHDVRLNGGASLPRLSPGDPLTVDIDVVAEEPVEDWVVGLAVLDHADLIAYGSNTHLLRIDLGRLDGKRTVRFHLPEVHLAEDTYHVTVAVHPSVGPEWHRLDRVRPFRVLSDQRQVGVVHIAAQVDILE